MKTTISPIPIYDDNYVWVIDDGHYAVVVDPGLAEPVDDFLLKNKLTLCAILLTHHHWDHINGLQALYENWRCEVYGPDDDRIPAVQTIVKEGDVVHIKPLELSFTVMATPGHTTSHICFYNDDVLFCGDTLFSLGCGRMFEGTAEQFVNSLNKIKSLPAELMVYCTHEYTLSNIAFVESVLPESDAIQQKKEWAKSLRKRNQPTLPVKLKDELSLNPFLLTDSHSFQQHLNRIYNADVADEVSAFTLLRTAKDNF